MCSSQIAQVPWIRATVPSTGRSEHSVEEQFLLLELRGLRGPGFAVASVLCFSFSCPDQESGATQCLIRRHVLTEHQPKRGREGWATGLSGKLWHAATRHPPVKMPGCGASG